MATIFTPEDLAEMERAVSDCCGIGSLANDHIWDDGDGESGPHLSCNPSAATMLHHLLDVAAWIGTPDFRAKAGPYFGSRPPESWQEQNEWCYFHDEIAAEEAELDSVRSAE